MLKKLRVHKVINYKEVNWWELEGFQKNPFDTIIDVRGTSFYKASINTVIKSRKDGGVFVAVTGDDPFPILKTFSAVFSFSLNFYGDHFGLEVDFGEQVIRLVHLSFAYQIKGCLLNISEN